MRLRIVWFSSNLLYFNLQNIRNISYLEFSKFTSHFSVILYYKTGVSSKNNEMLRFAQHDRKLAEGNLVVFRFFLNNNDY